MIIRFLLVTSVFLVGVFINSAAVAQPEWADQEEKLNAPAAVGASVEEADVVFWFVSSNEEPFNDVAWTKHEELLELMSANSIRARFEHYYTSQLAERWHSAVKHELLPNLIVGRAPAGRGLMQDGVVRDVISTRLHYPDATSSCSDFKVLSRIWQVLEAPNSELAEQAIAALLAPRESASLGPVLKLSNVERVLVTTKAKTVAQAWLKYDFAELDKHWHERAPQRFVAATIDKELAKSESKYRDATQFRKVQFYGTSTLIIAMVDVVSKLESDEQVAWFIAKSSINQSPVCVMLLRADGEYRVVAVGTWRYDMSPDDNAAEALFSFMNKKPLAAGETINKAEILEPAERRVFGNDPFKIRWKGSQNGSESDNFFSVLRHRDGHISIVRLQTGREFEACVRGESELAIWNIASDGQIGFSNTVHLKYDPDLKSELGVKAESK